jgi:hypothetical protein
MTRARLRKLDEPSAVARTEALRENCDIRFVLETTTLMNPCNANKQRPASMKAGVEGGTTI